MEKEIKKLETLIKKSNKILLINHIRMDPDALWSLWAFYFVMKKLEKEVKATNDSLPPLNFEFLWANEIIEADLDIKKYNPDLIISFDAASLSQLWETYKNYEDVFKNTDFVVIDHHQTNPLFWSLNIVNPKFSSTCELIFFIFEKLDLVKYIWKKEASLLTAWIHTDTNIFYNQNTTPNTLYTAWKLMELGADFRASIYNFFNKVSLNKLKLYAKIYEKLETEKNWKIVFAYIKKEDFITTNTTLEDSSGIINRLSNIENMEVVFLVFELENDFKKVSFRSKNFDVAKLCASFKNWWWHKNAAWFTSNKSFSELKNQILEKLKEI